MASSSSSELQGALAFVQALEHFLGSFEIDGLFLIALTFLLQARQRLFDGGNIGKDQFGFDGFNVALRVNLLGYVLYVRIAEKTNHFTDGVRFANIRQEFIAQTFALRSTGTQACNINEFHRCRDDLRRVIDGGKAVKSLIGNGNQANIGLDGCKRIVCSKSALLRKGGKQRRLANVRQANNAN